jgi:hypothetical protein
MQRGAVVLPQAEHVWAAQQQGERAPADTDASVADAKKGKRTTRAPAKAVVREEDATPSARPKRVRR